MHTCNILIIERIYSKKSIYSIIMCIKGNTIDMYQITKASYTFSKICY